MNTVMGQLVLRLVLVLSTTAAPPNLIQLSVVSQGSTLLGHSLNFGTLQHPNEWKRFNIKDPGLINLVKGLTSPLGSILRVGGSETEFVTFCEKCSHQKHPLGFERRNFTAMNLTGEDMDKILLFCGLTGFKLLLDLNVALRDSNDNWDPTNALELIQYIGRQPNHPPILFQLGNEPNSFLRIIKRTISAQQLAHDYKTLRKLLDGHGFRDSPLFGPEVTSPKKELLETPPDQYLKDFLSCDPPVKHISWHQYYVDGREATSHNFTDPAVFDRLQKEIDIFSRVVQSQSNKSMVLTETGSAWGGGAANLSDKFIAGFMLMDKLGIAAKNGIKLVTRQAIYHGHYALLDNRIQPNPDYWIALLYSRLTSGGKDSRVYSTNPQPDKRVRVYAHSGYNNSIIVMVVNVSPHSSEFRLTFDGKVFSQYEQFVLTPLHGNLQSSVSLLNNHKLKMVGDNLPPLDGIMAGRVHSPPYSVGFYRTLA